MFKTISQIGIIYSDSILTRRASKGTFPSKAPKPGTRLPYIEFESTPGDRINSQSLIKGSMQILFFDKTNNEASEFEKFINEYPEISVYKIPFTNGSEELYKQFGITKQGYFLIRPDLYIAYRCNDLDTAHFGQFLHNFLR